MRVRFGAGVLTPWSALPVASGRSTVKRCESPSRSRTGLPIRPPVGEPLDDLSEAERRVEPHVCLHRHDDATRLRLVCERQSESARYASELREALQRATVTAAVSRDRVYATLTEPRYRAGPVDSPQSGESACAAAPYHPHRTG